MLIYYDHTYAYAYILSIIYLHGWWTIHINEKNVEQRIPYDVAIRLLYFRSVLYLLMRGVSRELQEMG